MIAQISIGDSVLDIAEGSFAVDSCYAAGKSSDSQQPSETFCTRENDPLMPVDTQDLSGADAVVAAFESFCIEGLSMPKDEAAKDIMKVNDIVKSSSLCNDQTRDTLKVNNSVEPLILKDGEKNTVMKVDGASETKALDMTSSSTCGQNSFKNKLDPVSRDKRPVRNCRKKANKKVVLDYTSLQIIRRRRSSLSKRARSTAWGLMSNITLPSEQSSGHDVTPDDTKGSRRPRGGQGNGKQEKSMRARSSATLKQKTHTSTGRISLKVKFGKQAVGTMSILPVIDDNKEQKDPGSKNAFCELPKDAKTFLEEESPESLQFQFTDGDLEKASGMHLSIKDSSGKLGRNTTVDLCESPSYDEVDKVGETDNGVLDSGTSPDSEVINVLPDSHISRKDSEELHHVLIPSSGFDVSGNGCGLSLPWQHNDQERRKDQLHETGDCCLNDGIPIPADLNKCQEFAKLGERENMGDHSYSSDTSTSTSSENASGHASNMKVFFEESLPYPEANEFANCCGASNVETGTKTNLSATLDEPHESALSVVSQSSLPCSEGKKLKKTSRSRKVTKSKSEMPNLSSRSGKASKKKGNHEKSAPKCKNKEKAVDDQIIQEVDNLPETGNYLLSRNGEAGETGEKNLNSIMAGKDDEYRPSRNAWVSCDVCHKWRRIPAELADKIEETNCRWVCEDNKDRKFARCPIPQEKSNAEINAELEISDASCEEDACDVHLTSNKPRGSRSRVNEQSPWTLIKTNLFLHRRRKTQSIDEIMVCGCKKPLDGRMGCGAKCLNRMLNIECIPGTCPCGESCSNQQFQKRKYAKLKSFKCGKKGYGLQLVEDVSEGHFLIEYVGEVLDMHAYEARQREYARKGHKHFYFMTLNGSEVIDACAKGNLGRFINHSCEPNCRTEKWMVNGEVCIGIFALRDIQKGEEVTFDYNYVRVFGAAAKKCVCRSSQCRGYIGGDPVNSDIIVQGDSDEEYPEPVMVCEDDEMDQNIYNIPSMTSSLNEKEVSMVKQSSEQVDEINGTLFNRGQAEISTEKQSLEMFFRDKVQVDSSTTATGFSDVTKDSRELMNKSASIPLKIKIPLENECLVGQHSPWVKSGDSTSRDVLLVPGECLATEKSKKNPLSLNQGSNTESLIVESDISWPDTSDAKKKSKSSDGQNEVVLSKSQPRTKISGKLFSDKKRKSKINTVNVKKPPEIDNNLYVLPLKPKRLLEDPSNGPIEAGRFEAVQEKLNELLDSDGGISKRKDASRGYLKLLLLTAASGDSGNGEAIQSNRDLSMILDALLKTKSRTVLVDIINKNGLQMLHNIMKRYRKEFIKIPILRKLLKVLEYLATREILTSEHINGGPRCPGVESFRDSILTLTEHQDKQVHQIARSFRDRWIPRCFRKYGCMDRDDCRKEFHRGLSHDKFPAPHNNLSDHCAKTPETVDSGAKSVAVFSTDPGKLEGGSASRNARKRKSRWDQPYKGRPGLVSETDLAGDGASIMEEDVPPGFSSPRSGPIPPPDTSSSVMDPQKEMSSHWMCPSQVAIGHSQQRFISRLPIAYGVPMSILQHFGTQRSETSESWIVAPGMPFHPFPPLPQYPRDQNRCISGQVAQNSEQNVHNHATPDSSQNPPTTSAGAAPDLEVPVAINQSDSQRVRAHNNLGRKYFRQQKWNNSKLAPPWVRMRNGWGFSGMNTRNGMCPPGFGIGLNEFKNSYTSPDISPGVQNVNTFHQHPQQHNWN